MENMLTELQDNRPIETTEDGSAVLSFTESSAMFSSFVPATRVEKLKFYNMINNPDKSAKECVNMTIMLRDVYAETVKFVDKRGNETPGYRIILIDENGVSYKCASNGVFGSLTKLFNICGYPNKWEEPIPVVFRLKNTNNGRNVLMLEIDI